MLEVRSKVHSLLLLRWRSGVRSRECVLVEMRWLGLRCEGLGRLGGGFGLKRDLCELPVGSGGDDGFDTAADAGAGAVTGGEDVDDVFAIELLAEVSEWRGCCGSIIFSLVCVVEMIQGEDLVVAEGEEEFIRTIGRNESGMGD